MFTQQLSEILQRKAKSIADLMYKVEQFQRFHGGN
jgi:hypothetical protein